ncbi:hypothetical protein [Alicyclobacillus sp. SP_1]|uniref:hypothetical protein n=1 Tax=Alicyclobacillus sp. SP_1 TaxID=2942475 RepID=UPI002157986B|nr:hypothetical protein [Alicyclobacillus sp. SP_1]
MGNSKTFNYPKTNSTQTSSQAGHSSRVAKRKPQPYAKQNVQQEGVDESPRP